jgi:hypothetical protein
MSGGSVGVTLHSESRIIDVGQGIFALRYVASTAKADAPRVVVEPFQDVGLSVISAPGGADRVLDGPGSCLLIRSERPARFTLTVAGRTPTRGSRPSVSPSHGSRFSHMSHDAATPCSRWAPGSVALRCRAGSKA